MSNMNITGNINDLKYNKVFGEIRFEIIIGYKFENGTYILSVFGYKNDRQFLQRISDNVKTLSEIEVDMNYLFDLYTKNKN